MGEAGLSHGPKPRLLPGMFPLIPGSPSPLRDCTVPQSVLLQNYSDTQGPGLSLLFRDFAFPDWGLGSLLPKLISPGSQTL